MIAAALGFAAAALVFAGFALALGIRNGRLDGDNRVLLADRERLREALKELTDELAAANVRNAQAERENERERRRIYDQIREKYGDAAVGDLAVDELERLLSPPQSDADNDPDY